MDGHASGPEAAVVEIGADGYPPLLAHLAAPPSPLHVAGRIIATDQVAVAVVGSRTPTPYGVRMARRIAGDLARRGVTVVSGFARGVDAAAHAAALEAGGRTIAVLGCGLDVDYPRDSGALRSRIREAGALISEFPSGTPPLPGHFIRRNRVISGLSLGVVVVQAGHRSGSLVTARWALDQGREVMAVPGRADEDLSAGPMALLRDGAAAVADAEDILRCLGLELPSGSAMKAGTDSPLRMALCEGGRTVDELCRMTGREAVEILAELSQLEVEGRAMRDAAGRYGLCK